MRTQGIQVRGRWGWIRLLFLGFTLVVAGCGGTPSGRFTLGTPLLTDEFNETFRWDSYNDSDTQMGVQAGVFGIHSNRRDFVRGYYVTQEYSDIVLEAESIQFSPQQNNAYGLVCRGSRGSAAAGYYFLISSDGSYSIQRGRGDQLDELVFWGQSNAIHRGTDKNVMKAVCVGDYLAMYVNDTFVADTHDSTFTQGYAGFTAAASKGETVDVTFDNLKVWNGSSG